MDDETIIGALRKEILATPKINHVNTPEEWDEILEETKMLPKVDKIKDDWHWGKVLPYQTITPKLPKRVPRKWFAPFYNIYCKIKYKLC